MDIEIDLIKRSPHQPRLIFDLDELKSSIEKDGILIPLTVRKKKDGYYELIDGERRWRASKELNYNTVPCNVLDVDEETADKMSWKVNTVRLDYGPKEKAFHFREHQKEGKSLKDISETHGISVTQIKAYFNVFNLPEKYQELVWSREIGIGVIHELHELLNGLWYQTPENSPFVLEILDKAAREKHFGQKEVREAIKPHQAKLRKELIIKTQKSLSKIYPDVRVPETPEELEKASTALRLEAKKKREELLTPEARSKREDEIKNLEEKRRARNQERIMQLEKEAIMKAKRIEEFEKRRIEEAAKLEARKEALNDPNFLRIAQKEAEKLPKKDTQSTFDTPQKQGYQTLDEPLQIQYQHQREWNLKQIIGKDLLGKGKKFQFDFYTVGYSQKNVRDVIELLKLGNVSVLIDVRKNPYSLYKPEFNKEKFQKELKTVGIDYIHLPELGISREERDEYYNGTATIDTLFNKYDDVLRNGGLETLEKTVSGRGIFAIMCTEVDPTKCHRHKIASALNEKGLIGYDI